jgi:hypothetical protein
MRRVFTTLSKAMLLVVLLAGAVLLAWAFEARKMSYRTRRELPVHDSRMIFS